MAQGLDETTVRRVLGMVARNEFKRQQAPPGLRVSRKAFGQGRRIPIVGSALDWLDARGGARRVDSPIRGELSSLVQSPA